MKYTGIKVEIITKKVTGVPWDQKFEHNLFMAIIYLGLQKEPDVTSGVWAKSPNEAIEYATKKLANQIKSLTLYSCIDFKLDDMHSGRGKYHYSNYHGYYQIRGQNDS
jgi:hypothetical protein